MKRINRPNILFIMTDQQRFDSLGCMGNDVAITPWLDGLAADGARFANAYSCSPTCTPARSAILTGLDPWRHGMLGYGRVASRYRYEMPRAMAEAGYYLGAFGKMHWFPQKLHRGFHELLVDESGRIESAGFVSDYIKWFAQEVPGEDAFATGIGWNTYCSGVYAYNERLHPTAWTGSKAVEFIEEYDRDEPFMLKVSFARPHSPYDAPKRFWKMYEWREIPQRWVGDWAERYAERSGEEDDLWHGDIGQELTSAARRGYLANVSFIDEQVGNILQSLKAKGFYENTLILFTSDHGDMLGDHHLWRKSYGFEGSCHVPMLLRWPDGLEVTAERGVVIDEPVELRDIFPTFMDTAGVAMREEVEGESLLKLLRGDGNNWREWIDLEHSSCYKGNGDWNGGTDGKIKYIFVASTGEEMLFDLQEGRGELCNLAGDKGYAEVLRLWRERLVGYLAERGEEYVKDGALVYPRASGLYSPNYPG